MDTAKELARLLPEMARMAQTSRVTADALYALLAGMRRSYWTREISELLRVAMQRIEEVNMAADEVARTTACRQLEETCRELGTALVGRDTDRPAPNVESGTGPSEVSNGQPGN